jgi:hypothetical protein
MGWMGYSIIFWGDDFPTKKLVLQYLKHAADDNQRDNADNTKKAINKLKSMMGTMGVSN